MISRDSVERLVHECYAAHFIFTNMGYEPDEVFIGVAPLLNVETPGPCAFVKLERGELSFVLPIEPVRGEQAARFKRAWREFVDAKPDMPRDSLDRIVHRSLVWARRAEILTALSAKGFELEPGRMRN